MRVFISWSGHASRAVAELLRTYLPCMLQDIHPFVSSHDLASGARWSIELSKELDEATFGIICLTPDNLHNDWVLFEAGALTKHVEGRACCLLFQRLGPADVSGPLAQFQNRKFERSEFAKLLADLNRLLPVPLPQPSLEMIFEKWWPDLEANVQAALARLPSQSESTRREPNDIFDELLLRVRNIQKQVEGVILRGAPAHEAAAGTSAWERAWTEEQFFTVSFARLQSPSPEILVRLDPLVTFQGFLDEMYNHISDQVPPYTYGMTWVFRDEETGAVVTHARMHAGTAARSDIKDQRRLTEVGIRPGARLEAVRTSDLRAA